MSLTIGLVIYCLLVLDKSMSLFEPKFSSQATIIRLRSQILLRMLLFWWLLLSNHPPLSRGAPPDN